MHGLIRRKNVLLSNKVFNSLRVFNSLNALSDVCVNGTQHIINISNYNLSLFFVDVSTKTIIKGFNLMNLL